ncbi:MAG TPA: hypothetical protein VJ507_03435 [Candidatus Bathyarchaeia archaeon]|nr:hypothetical protein [Candidatus Bathyarchaeia archaeon]
MVIAVGLSYTIITSYIEADVKKQQLKQISEYVALNIVEIANLVNFETLKESNMTRTLSLPTELNGNAYTIQLVDWTSQGRGYQVNASLLTRNIYTTSPIPINSTQTHLSISCSGKVYPGEGRTIIVWGSKTNVNEGVAGITQKGAT